MRAQTQAQEPNDTWVNRRVGNQLKAHSSSGVHSFDQISRASSAADPVGFVMDRLPHSVLGSDSHDDPETRRQLRITCCEFVQMLVFITVFLTTMWLHEDVYSVFNLENAIQTELLDLPFGPHSLLFEDVKDMKHFWEWMHESFLEHVYEQHDALGHELPHSKWGYIAQFNKIVGGIRLTQTRSKSNDCLYRRLSDFYDPCYPDDTMSHQPFGYPACSEFDDAEYDDDYSREHNITVCYEENNYSSYVDLNHDEGFSPSGHGVFEMWLDIESAKATAIKRIEYLEERHWIDEQTNGVDITFLIYNGQMEPMISEVKLHFDLSRVGIITPVPKLETVPLDPYFSDLNLKVFLEIIFLLTLFHMIYMEARHVLATRQEHGCSLSRALFVHYVRGSAAFGSCVNLALILVCFLVLSFWVVFVLSMKTVRKAVVQADRVRPDSLLDYGNDDDALYSVWEHYHEELVEAEHKTTLAIESMVVIRELSALAMFVMVFRLFKICAGIPALKGITQTIIIALKRLLAFGVILVCLISLFAGAGMLVFGQQMEEFHTFARAVISTLIIMTTGEAYYFDRQYEIDPILASLWHWLLMAIMWVVCLNIILCILVDSYAEAKAQAAEASLSNGEPPSLTGQSLAVLTDMVSSLQDRTSVDLRTTASTFLPKLKRPVMPTTDQDEDTMSVPRKSQASQVHEEV